MASDRISVLFKFRPELLARVDGRAKSVGMSRTAMIDALIEDGLLVNETIDGSDDNLGHHGPKARDKRGPEIFGTDATVRIPAKVAGVAIRPASTLRDEVDARTLNAAPKVDLQFGPTPRAPGSLLIEKKHKTR